RTRTMNFENLHSAFFILHSAFSTLQRPVRNLTRRIAIAAPLIALTVAPVWPQAAPNGTNAVVPPNAKLEKVFDRGVFLEGPAAAPDGSIYFSDLTSPADS